MGSYEGDLAPETRALSLLLGLIESEPRMTGKPGAVAFASSAGAMYARSPAIVISENTPHAPRAACITSRRACTPLASTFASAIIKHARASGLSSVLRLVPIATSEQALPASRPANSVLSNRKVAQTFGLSMLTWDRAFALCAEAG